MKTLILFTIILGIAASSAAAAVVYLKGGGSLQGTVVKSDARQVVLDTSQGRVGIDASRVQRIDESGAPSPRAPSPPAAPAVRSEPAAARKSADLFEPRNQSLSLDLGLAAPLSSIDFSGISFGGVPGGQANNGDVGARIGLQYLYFPSPRAGWGGEVAYVGRSATDSPGLMPNAFSHVSGDSLVLLGDLKYSLRADGDVRPYLLLGAGAHYTSTTVDVRPNPGFVWSDTLTDEGRRLVDGSSWGPALSVRLGLDFMFAEPSVFGLEAGWTGLLNAAYRATSQGQASGLSGASPMLNFFTLSGRWGWSF
jgi:opacity protein-like surface antigen